MTNSLKGFPARRWWSGTRLPVQQTGDPGSIPGAGRSPGGGHGNPLQYSCLENPMDTGAWWLQSVESQSQTRLSEQALQRTGRGQACWQRPSAGARLLPSLLTWVARRTGPQTDAPLSCFPPPSLPPVWQQKSLSVNALVRVSCVL